MTDERAVTTEGILEELLAGLDEMGLPPGHVVDLRDVMPHPDRVPAGLETRMTVAEIRRRVRNVRAAL